MTIQKIAYAINKRAIGHPFGAIQEIRKKYLRKVGSYSPFAKPGIKDTYAFHSGGRKELQFNFGRNNIGGKDVFRYGVAFSLQRGQSLHDPKAEFRPIIKSFNRFLKSDPSYFDGLVMWYHSHHEFKELFSQVREIDDKIFQTDNFIFIGKYFDKDVNQIIQKDIDEIIETFDHLMTMYEVVQFGASKKEKRIARLCWNDKGWVMPSGKHGKSKDKNTHEAKHGYGHEEWLFDTSKLIDGYHYSFLEPIRKQQQAFVKKKYDVWLYTIENITKKRFWVGEIKNVEVIGAEEANRVKAIYRKKGWLKEMESQLKVTDDRIRGFSNWNGVDLFNIRFKPSDHKVNDPYVELEKNHRIMDFRRYTFAEFSEDLEVGLTAEDNFDFNTGDHQSESGETSVKNKKSFREPKAVQISFVHEAISKKLTIALKKRFGAKNVKRELKAGYGNNRIDIVVRVGSDLNFYEIKSYPSLRTSIREAVGQLIEYSHWTHQNKAKKLIIVTQPSNEIEEAVVYIKHIREKYNLPIYYQSYDFDKNILSEVY
ncbi:MAG: hypothetical protein RH948_01675 [Cyclobacteriaceae bacterium]